MAFALAVACVAAAPRAGAGDAAAQAVPPGTARAAAADGAPSAAAPVVSLLQVLQWARDGDPAWAAARAAADADREKLPQALAGLRPTLGFNASPRWTRERSTAYDGLRRYAAGGTSLSLSQPLLRPAAVLAVRQGELQAQQADLQQRLAEQDLLLRVSRAYLEVLQAEDALAAAQSQQDALGVQSAQARRLFEVGSVPVTDLNEARSRHDVAVAQTLAARNEMRVKQRVLERFTGRDTPALARLPARAVPPVPAGESLDLLAASAPQQALQAAVQQLAAEVAELEAQRQDAGHLPTMDLVLSTGTTRNTNFGASGVTSGADLRQTSVGVELSVPLYQGGAVSSRVREALANAGRARAELLVAQRQAAFDAGQALLGLRNGSALTGALAQAVDSGQTLLRSMQRGLQVGVRTRVDVLNAEQQLFLSRRDFATARYQTLLSLLQLKAAAGVLVEADVAAVDALLAPPASPAADARSAPP